MRVRTTPIVAACCFVLGLLIAAVPSAAADRPYDRDVAKLIDRANKDLGRFIGNMKGDAKGAKVTRGGVEYDVSDFLGDLKAEGGRLEERFAADAKAAPTALAFLQKAKAFDGFIDRHPGWSGADKEWTALRPTLDSLADAYEIDWSGDPDQWQAMRNSDAEIAGWAKQLDADIKGYASALSKAAKDAKVDSAARAGLTEQVKALTGGAKTLQKALSARTPAANAVESLARSAQAVAEQADSLGLSAAAESAAKPFLDTMTKISSALGVAPAGGST
jgi:hypothetical protein